MKPHADPDNKPSSARERSEPAPFAFWDRDRAHQDRLAKRIAQLRRTGRA